MPPIKIKTVHCNSCNKQFKSKLLMKKHTCKGISAGNKRFKKRLITEKEKVSKSYSSTDYKPEINSKFTCDNCYSIFSTKGDYISHVMKCLDEDYKPYLLNCSCGSLSFKNEQEKLIHLCKNHTLTPREDRNKITTDIATGLPYVYTERINPTTNDFICPFCESHFKTPNDLLIHGENGYCSKFQVEECMKISNANIKYSCIKCEKCLLNFGKYIRHMAFCGLNGNKETKLQNCSESISKLEQIAYPEETIIRFDF